MKQLKTPLRYPGGKSRAVKKLFGYYPLNKTEYKEFREPFLGGGSFALEWTKRFPDTKVWVNDLYEPLANFWMELQHDGEALQNSVWKTKNLHPDRDTARELFEQAKEDINNKGLTNIERAVAFYVTNKCSFSGLTESSSFSPQASESNFSYRGIEKLAEYGKLIQHWKITNSTYTDLLTDDPTVFMYSDPPYEISSNLYGRKGAMHKKFDHDQFASDCDDACADHIISYNSSQLIRDRFVNWNASEFDHTYTMRSVGKYMLEQMDRKELVLTNYTV
tara:strand:+ start:858 stop:1688 length:831 start_codon:yes stop_codon:yes gene_type:complete